MQRRFACRVLAVLSAYSLAAIAAQSPSYHVATLPDLGGGSVAYVNGMNAAGSVVGAIHRQTGKSFAPTAVLWKDGVAIDLGAGAPGESSALSINAAGQVVGSARDSANIGHSILWQDKRAIDLGAPSGFTNARAFGINDTGHAVGFIDVGGRVRATEWLRSVFAFLPDLPGALNSSAQSISNRGLVVGYTYTNRVAALQYGLRATAWREGQVTDLGMLPGTIASTAEGVNDLTQIVGMSIDASGRHHPTLWTNGQPVALPLLPGSVSGYVRKINNRGECVGWNSDGSRSRATLWQNGVVYDLNDLISSDLRPFLTITQATGINDSGQIVAYGNDSRSADQKGFLLTPIVKVADKLAALSAKVNGVEPGRSLSNKVRLAETHFRASNFREMCSALTAFVNEVWEKSGKTIDPTLAQKLASDAYAIQAACGLR